MKEPLDPKSAQDMHKLVDDLRSDRPVLGVCGAGVSLPLGYPSWGELMVKMIDAMVARSHIAVPSDLRMMVKSKNADLPELAELVKGMMHSEDFYECLADIFSPRADVDLSYEYECLVRLPVRLWLTTNYDRCLDEALRDRLQQTISTPQSIPFERLFEREVIPTVVHLHGHIDEPDSLVITASDYDERYYRSAASTRSWKSLAAVTLLFIGYSLSEDVINSCMRETKALLGRHASRSYALLPSPSGQGALELARSRLLRMGVRPIFFHGRTPFHSERLTVVLGILRDLNIPEPTHRKEVAVGWGPNALPCAEFRRKLRTVRQAARLESPVVLRSCSFYDRRAALSVDNDAAMHKLRTAIESSDFRMLEQAGDVVRGITPRGPTGKAATPDIVVQGDLSRLRVARDLIESNSVVGSGDFESVGVDSPHVESDEALDERQTEIQLRATAHAAALDIADSTSDAARAVLRPLMPPDLAFGLADCCHPVLSWRLDSPILHAWVYYDTAVGEGQTQRPLSITVVGGRTLSVRRRIDNAAYSVALSLKAKTGTVIINKSVVHLSCVDAAHMSSRSRRTVRSLVDAMFGRESADIPPAIATTDGEALVPIVTLLREMAQQTGVVCLHEGGFDELRHAVTSLQMDLSNAESRRHPTIYRPRIQGGVVTCFPVPGFPYLDKPILQLELSADLLCTPLFRELVGSFYMEVLSLMRADTERRIAFWTTERDKDRSDHDWYKDLTKEEQDKVPDVVTDRQILPEYGIDVAVPERRVSARTYYMHNLPEYHIPQADAEIRRLEPEHGRIEELVKEEDNVLRDICISQIFDCALRKMDLSDDSRVRMLFNAWCSKTTPMLQLELARLLDQCAIDPEDVFRRTMFFETRANKAKGKTILLSMTQVVDTSRATIIIDRSRKTLVVNDILDTATNQNVAPNSEAAERDLKEALVPHEGDDVTPGLRSCIHSNPAILVALTRFVAEASGAREAYLEARKQVGRLALSANAGERFIRLRNQLAFNTAVEALSPEDESNPPPGKALMLFWVNCERYGFPPLDTLKELSTNHSYRVPDPIRVCFEQVTRSGPEVVNRFLTHKGVGTDAMTLSDVQLRALNIEHCLEATRLHRCLMEAASSLDLKGESLSSAFLKCEEALEAIYLSVYTKPNPSIFKLQRILTGEPLQREM